MKTSFALGAAMLLFGCGALPPGSAALTPIYRIQGAGPASPLAGQRVATQGVVTRVDNNGYFMQDETGDGDPATSDGIFVFTGGAPSVAAGDRVQLTARVTEFNTGSATNAETLAHTVTELTGVASQKVLASGVRIAPTVVALPQGTRDDLRRYEGMLVRIEVPLAVSQNYFLGRFGQLTLAAGGRLETPTNRWRPGSPEAAALADENARRRIVLDDGSSLQYPVPVPYLAADGTVRAGDTVHGITGVIDYGLSGADSTGPGDYRIHPTEPVAFTRDNPRPAAPRAAGSDVTVASFNVMNYFTSLADGKHVCAPSRTAADCRGARSAVEFMRQRTKLVEALAALHADAVGLMEIENNGGVALQDLLDGLNAKLGAGTYAAVPAPAAGTGRDAIQVAIIYRPAVLSRVGDATADADPVHNRPPLAQTFAVRRGGRFTLVANHFKSKGCDGAAGADTDRHDGQACFNVRRVQQGQALRRFVAALQARNRSDDVILLGDFNAYAQEDPIAGFTGSGWVDEIARFNRFGYSYVFDGAAGRLDQALATPSLSRHVVGAREWHINADEPAVIDYTLESKPQDGYAPTPYRSSDHDPLVVELRFAAAPAAAPRKTTRRPPQSSKGGASAAKAPRARS